ncbi:hypothetical protein GCM10009416_25910 [Craurococcus roseus]|uniref:Peptidase M48 domain-containing protein n=1 Tax=Craurococcus roseus TaxID=77585 RepID=A0ABP3QCW3_9PROT
MLRVNGFYGHVKRNDLRSAAMFGGFLVAFQVVAAVVLFLPLLFLDPLHAPPLGTFGYAERYVPLVFAAGVLLFIVQFSRHVASVRTTVAFRYVDRWTERRLVDAVETQAIAAGLPLPKVGLIDSPARNAFACGLGARSAVVVATRGLVEALDDDELAAVVAHEIAHIRNGDIRLMAAANVLMDNLECLRRQGPLRIVDWKQVVLCVLVPPFLFLCFAAGLANGAAFALARVSRLLISSSREFVADAEAVRMTHNPAALISALLCIEGRSAVEGVGVQFDAMMIDGAVDGPFASHPTIAERVAVLERLSGAMAHVPVARRDTRTAADGAAGRGGGGFGCGTAPGLGSAPAPVGRGVFGRVSAGQRGNPLGLTPANRRLLVLGFGGMAALYLWVMVQHSGGARTILSRLSGEALVAGIKELLHEGERGVFSSAGGVTIAKGRALPLTPTQELQRLAAADPLAARCFATEPYRVGDRSLYRLRPPDPALVQAYGTGHGRDSSEVKPERYLGRKLLTARHVAGAEGAELDRALASYVRERKLFLEIMHRFFGEPGLALMRDAYGSPEDLAILDTLRRRRDDRAPALTGDARLAAEIELLLSAPESFIPCVARAG